MRAGKKKRNKMVSGQHVKIVTCAPYRDAGINWEKNTRLNASVKESTEAENEITFPRCNDC